MRQEIQDRFERNVRRVRNLVSVYGGLSGEGAGRRPVNASDILRAATVLLHATIEDLLRSLELWKLPSAAPERLAKIPIAGSDGRAEKFNLESVARFRGTTVSDLLSQSISEHLDRKSYNNSREIASTLERLGIDTQPFKQHFVLIEPLMKRRHHIVHRADANESVGSGHHRAQSISRASVEGWISVVEAFGADLLNRV